MEPASGSAGPVRSSPDDRLFQQPARAVQGTGRRQGSMPNHEMVVEFNLKRLRGRLQFARSLEVLPRRLGIAGWIIVHTMRAEALRITAS